MTPEDKTLCVLLNLNHSLNNVWFQFFTYLISIRIHRTSLSSLLDVQSACLTGLLSESCPLFLFLVSFTELLKHQANTQHAARLLPADSCKVSELPDDELTLFIQPNAAD